MRASARREPVLLVPDLGSWAAAGIDPSRSGFDPVPEPSAASKLVLPDRLPEALGPAVAELWLRLPDPSAVELLPGEPSGAGAPARELLEAAAAEATAASYEESSDDSDDHDHGDMMAVEGEPSRDGLVMEEARAVIGPLAPALPSGLELELELDGDVVASAAISGVLGSPLEFPSPLCRAAASWAAARGGEGGLAPSPAATARHLVATEAERALSHGSWLMRFAVLLGWVDLAERLRRALSPLIEVHATSSPGPSDGEQRVHLPANQLEDLERVLSMALGSRRLASRTAGLAVASLDVCREAGIRGPALRAAGGTDPRASDPPYMELGFEPVQRTSGDAHARAEVRAEEALAALSLIRAASAAGGLPPGEGAVEGPRGPLALAAAGPSGARVLVEEGAKAAARCAESAAEGLELARALVAVISFDLDPWTVGG